VQQLPLPSTMLVHIAPLPRPQPPARLQPHVPPPVAATHTLPPGLAWVQSAQAPPVLPQAVLPRPATQVLLAQQPWLQAVVLPLPHFVSQVCLFVLQA
jgi:hypothetical protein